VTWLGHVGGECDEPPNKGMKQTKPSVLELRSLSPVFDGLLVERRGKAWLDFGSACGV
jgi:hypothetical protein